MIEEFTGTYDFLSNFHPSPFEAHWYTEPTWQVSPWPTVEHYFQAAKAGKYFDARKIIVASTPGEAKWFGQQVALVPNWEVIKYDVMLRALRLKFSHRPLAELLAATAHETLVEGNRHGDQIWGACWVPSDTGSDHLAVGHNLWRSDGTRRLVGTNWLGRLLMLVREEVRAAL